jgi:hypothetical protein
MTTPKATTSGAIDTEVTVADLQDVGGSTATRTVSATVPRPAIVANEATSASAESIILTIALGQCRGVVDIRFTNLSHDRRHGNVKI